MDALAFWGSEYLLGEVREWLDGREDDPDWDGEWWLDNVWAEGGCCIDLDNRLLLIYGGEDIECDVLWLETYLRLLPYTWPGWSVEWAWGELGQIARYAGVRGKQLEEIDCKVVHRPGGKWLEEYVNQVFDIPKWRLPGSSTLSVRRDGLTKAAFLDETQPENVLFIGARVDDAIARLGDVPLTYDCDEFLMGGLHLDYDTGDVWLWRTWDNNIEVDLPDQWGGWRLHDLRHDYRSFYRAVPGVVDFVLRPESDYVGKVADWVLRISEYEGPRGMEPEERERILSDVLRRYRADNVRPRYVPDLSQEVDGR